MELILLACETYHLHDNNFLFPRRPNETLLSINCFQKDLGDPNPLVRAWALRTMAGIRLHVIAPLVLVAVGKCARDPSTYVRKCAAIALPKLHDLHLEEHTSAIEEVSVVAPVPSLSPLFDGFFHLFTCNCYIPSVSLEEI